VCCFADLLPGGAKTPETLMSHWWGNTFLSLVKAICEHAAGKSELYGARRAAPKPRARASSGRLI
jgi:hypothetical protein